ncbi:MAG TPA: Hsp20/alpha crystallin family protein [Bdellovibrionales bacterium]|nr:Hsp20/alpha crystallin family protein [Bdellovibrionales bacterium]
MRSFSPAWDDETGQTMMGFNPACDIEEQDDHFRISVDLPGVSKDDVKVEVVDNRLVISGERKHEKKEGGRRSERYYGRFERSFMLPTAIDVDKIEARYENGVLELAVPKAESAKPRTVQIQTGKEGFLGRFLNRGKTIEGSKDKPTEKGRLVS